MKHVYRKGLGCLWPKDEAGKIQLDKIPDGSYVTVEVKRPRSIQFHRRYWALVSLVWDNIDHERYPSPEELHSALKICAGIRTRIELPDGTVGFIPGSIAFDKMSADEFYAFHERICNLVCKHFIPGLEPGALKDQLSEFVGLAA